MCNHSYMAQRILTSTLTLRCVILLATLGSQYLNPRSLTCAEWSIASYLLSAIQTYPLLKFHPTPISTTQHQRQSLPLGPHRLILLPGR